MTKQIGISATELKQILNQKDAQPQSWRVARDKEAEYKDGNQLTSLALAHLQSLGIAPAMDNLIAQAVRDVCSVAEQNRKDARLIAQPNAEQDTVDALSEKLFKAEEESNADRSCLTAHEAQAGVGIGWVEPSRNPDPFGPRYRTRYISRNDIWWDMHAPIHDLQRAMWMLRQKWVHRDAAITTFPQHKKAIEEATKYGNNGHQWFSEGGETTGLVDGRKDSFREWTVEEHNWLDRDSNRICLYETVTKTIEFGLIIRLPDGRVIEFDKSNPGHLAAAAEGTVEKAPLIRLDQTFFLGPVRLGARRLKSRKFPYILFYYFTEDLTEIPYGIIKALMYLQDEHNARLANYIWGLGAVTTIRTAGAVAMPDELFRQVVGRRDADIVLNAEAMGKPGAIFDIKRDYELTQQQYARTMDLRDSVKEASGARDALTGSDGQTGAAGQREGFELASKSISGLTSRYEESRIAVLNGLLELIIEDSQKPEEVHIRAKMLQKARVVVINAESQDGAMTNDVQLVQAQVRLEDVPSSPDRNRQEMVSLSELGKSLPEKYQVALAPYIVSLSGVQFKEDLAEKFLELESLPNREQVDQQIKESVEAALLKERMKLKGRELDIKELETNARVDDTEAATALKRVEAALKRVETIYSGTQAALGVAGTPQIAPITQEIVNSAGFEDQNQAPVFGQPGAAETVYGSGKFQTAPVVEPETIPEVTKNTSPMFPPNPQPTNRAGPPSPSGMTLAAQADTGALGGIEKPGNQQEIE